MTDEKLKPCPFCGGEAEERAGSYACPNEYCPANCGSNQVFKDERGKRNAWNTRSGSSEDAKRLRATMTDVETVEKAIGMSHSGWDCVSPTELINAAWEALAARLDGEGK